MEIIFKKYFVNLLLLLTLISTSCSKDENFSPTAPDIKSLPDSLKILVDQLNNNIVELNKSPLNLTDEDLKPFSHLGNNSIIGLGEASHGTKEFFQMKHRLFKYLVEQHGFRVFAFESDFDESIQFDNFVTKNEGNIYDLLKTKMKTRPWQTEEVMNLLIWMREYNLTKTENEKIRFIGIDTGNFGYSVELIKNYINNFQPDFITEANPAINTINNIIGSNTSVYEYYKLKDEKKKNEINDIFENLLNKVKAEKNNFTAKSSESEYLIFEHIIYNLIQTNNYLYKFTKELDYVGENARDKIMAENAVWATNLLGSNTKVAIWAHNSHIENTNSYRNGTPAMGKYIKRIIGEGYKTIGFSTNHGSVRAAWKNNDGSYTWQTNTIPFQPVDNSINFYFDKVKYEQFVLNMNDFTISSELGKYLSQYQIFLQIGALLQPMGEQNYRPTILKEFYDIIIHFNNTNAAVALN